MKGTEKEKTMIIKAYENILTVYMLYLHPFNISFKIQFEFFILTAEILALFLLTFVVCHFSCVHLLVLFPILEFYKLFD